jgi:hypothetical protein
MNQWTYQKIRAVIYTVMLVDNPVSFLFQNAGAAQVPSAGNSGKKYDCPLNGDSGTEPVPGFGDEDFEPAPFPWNSIFED